MADLPLGLGRLFDHLAWADRRAVEVLTSNPDAVATRLLAHLLAAERIWFERLSGSHSEHPEVWPELDLVACAELARQNHEDFAGLLADLDLHEFARVVTYRNSRGVEFRHTLEDILHHVVLHGSYHRGQIAARLRAVGSTPMNTDFITFVREEPGGPPPGGEAS